MTRLTDIIALSLGAAALLTYILMWTLPEKPGLEGVLAVLLGVFVTGTLVTNIAGVVMDKK